MNQKSVLYETDRICYQTLRLVFDGLITRETYLATV